MTKNKNLADLSPGFNHILTKQTAVLFILLFYLFSHAQIFSSCKIFNGLI